METSQDLKVCTKCGWKLPATREFFALIARDGLLSRCKECDRACARAYHETHREEARVYHQAHREEHLARVKVYYQVHRDQERARVKAFRQDHLDEERANDRTYRQAHSAQFAAYARNHRALKLGNGGTHTPADIKAQCELQEGRCFYCGCELDGTYHVDHFVPLVLGGSNGPENLVIACSACNLSKGAKHPDEFDRPDTGAHGILQSVRVAR